jgi:hypothetical protein
MSTWLERFVLTVLAAVLFAIMANHWSLDRIQQATLFVAIAALALFVGHTIEKMRAPTANSSVSPAQESASSTTVVPSDGNDTVAADKNPTGLVVPRSAGTIMVTMSPLIPDPDQKPRNPNDLEFYFFAYQATAFGNTIEYADVTLTNRSPQKMHLEFWGAVDYWKDSGEPARYGMRAEWNPDGYKEGTGQESVDFDPFETKKGRLFLFLEKPEKSGLRKWFIDPGENVYIEVFDTVTGKRIAFKGMSGYPIDQMPSPLPPHQQLLTLAFPKVPDSPNLPTLESLDLLSRTRFSAYDGNRATVSAAITNLSNNRMELAINLLVLNANKWKAFDGVFRMSNDNKAPGTPTLSLGPDDSAEGTVDFDLAEIGVSNTTDPLSKLPSENLLEISELVSGKKVWCAISPGYPPGTDMRSLLINR